MKSLYLRCALTLKTWRNLTKTLDLDKHLINRSQDLENRIRYDNQCQEPRGFLGHITFQRKTEKSYIFQYMWEAAMKRPAAAMEASAPAKKGPAFGAGLEPARAAGRRPLPSRSLFAYGPGSNWHVPGRARKSVRLRAWIKLARARACKQLEGIRASAQDPQMTDVLACGPESNWHAPRRARAARAGSRCSPREACAGRRPEAAAPALGAVARGHTLFVKNDV